MKSREQHLDDLLIGLKALDHGQRPSAMVEQVVMARWDARAGAARQPIDLALADRPAPPRHWRWAFSRAVAATVMAASTVLLVLVNQPAPEPAEPARLVSPVASPPASEPPRTVSVVPEPSEPPKTRGSTSRTTRKQPRPSPQRVEQRIAFERLLPMEAEDLGPVRLMRVRFTSRAASSLGLVAQTSAGADGYVQADVLVGEDGLARAIRLVHQP